MYDHYADDQVGVDGNPKAEPNIGLPQAPLENIEQIAQVDSRRKYPPTSAHLLAEKMVVLGQAVVISGSRVLRRTTIRTDEGAKTLVAAVMIVQGVAGLPQDMELGARTVTMIVNPTKKNGVTDEITGAAVPTGIGSGTGVAVVPITGSDLPDHPAGS